MTLRSNIEHTTPAGFEAAHLTDTGKVRQMNQDATCLLQDPTGLPGVDTVAIVADGMGGPRGGEVASATVITTLSEELTRTPGAEGEGVRSIEETFQQAIKAANTAIRKIAQEQDLQGMGTTVTAVAASPDNAIIANVGDSRTYRLRSGYLEKLTDDHSLVAEQVRMGYLTEAEAEVHPQRNVITRALGIAPDVEADIQVVALEPGDILMLCSDGLYPVVPYEEIRTILEVYSPAAACQKLVEQANASGGPDNISVVVVRIPTGDTRGGRSQSNSTSASDITMRGGKVSQSRRGLLPRLVRTIFRRKH
jgi:protein phosphatase